MIRAVVWAAQGYRDSRWDCSRCSGQTRRDRGNCGASRMRPHVKGTPGGVKGMRKDIYGRWYLPMRAWMSEPATGDIDAAVEWCPTALSNQAVPLIEMYRRHRDKTLTLSEAFSSPSCAALAVVEAFGQAEAAHAAERDRKAILRRKRNAELARRGQGGRRV